jgi:hypothetical protein
MLRGASRCVEVVSKDNGSIGLSRDISGVFARIGMLPMLSAVHTHNLDLGGIHSKVDLSQIADNI